MKEINLRDYYPFYTNDMFVSVPDEVVEVLEEYRRCDEAYRIRTYRHGAFYSLDLNDGIEREIIVVQPSPFEILEQMHLREVLYKGLASLQDKQARRIYAHFFLGMSQRAIARAEGCNKSSVADSINSGLARLKKLLKKICSDAPPKA